MPLQQILPTWLAWNNCNFPTQSGIQDLRTGQDFPAGGLNLGDYFDATEKEANAASNNAIGILHSGRYRLVQVDSSATAANVKTGTVGYIRPGTFVQTVVITAAGSAGTNGTYTISATTGTGGGVGAVIQVTVSGGALTSASVVQGGFGYVSVPTFSMTTTGTGGTVAAQLNTTPNLVTSYDQAVTYGTQVNPIVFLNSITPGNYGFIQEQGVATVLAKTTSFTGAAAVGVVVQPTTGGVVDVPTSTTAITNATLGQAIDLPNVALAGVVGSGLFKIYIMDLEPTQD